MSLKETLGFGSNKKIRYAIVGLGDIAQEKMMPAVSHTGNSEITALVTGDPAKAEALGKRYNNAKSYSYEQFSQMLEDKAADAIYLATPNWRHAEFAVPALNAGVHVLVEKPLEVTVEKCQEILNAQKTSSAKLMVAYRLHFEPATVAAIEVVRSGKLGTAHLFNSTFAQNLDPKNHRAQNGVLAGPLFDMGPYPLNAARNLFGTEPIQVSALATRHPESGFRDLDDTVAVTLRFPENRLAQFVVSYFGNTTDSYTVVGTDGSLKVSPAYMFEKPLEHFLTIKDREEQKSFPATDHFGGELKYFSDCILTNKDPEPDGEEGLADVRVLEAIVESIKSGQPQDLKTFLRVKQIEADQVVKLSPVKAPELVNAASPAKEG